MHRQERQRVAVRERLPTAAAASWPNMRSAAAFQ
jgi:hypothetical protein